MQRIYLISAKDLEALKEQIWEMHLEIDASKRAVYKKILAKQIGKAVINLDNINVKIAVRATFDALMDD